MIQTQIGELIVGAHFRLIEDCEFVSYNQRSKEAGRQMEIDRIPSRLAKAEMSLAKTLVNFYTDFHGWRIFAEEYLDVTLDEFLAIIRPPEAADSPLDPFARPGGVPAVDEELCENTLSYYRDHLEAYQSLREEYADRAGIDRPDAPPLDLDERAEAVAQAIGEAGVGQYEVIQL
ncbi:hypothetical protein [Halobellus litoreus]|uniref:Uncharacterized protein n=1 Tax=Halobellus litoreus TaxID=755310 RepID=A0ABD6DUB6_9EURY|nr:hypothetical protein [Halobellus litoreus]